MAWYRIAENVLDAIANAINAKTGKTAPMTPVDMVSEIQSIQTGGGGKTLVASYTASEDVSAIRIDFTQAMQGYTYYIVELNGNVTGTAGLYFGLNTDTSNRYYSQLTGSYIYSAMINVYSSTKVALVGGSATQTYDLPISYLHIRAYNENSIIRTGAAVKIWGVS